MEIKELNIKQYIDISLMIDVYREDERGLNKELVKYFYGDLKPLKKDSDKMIESLNKVLSQDSSTILRFKFKGVEYGMIPNLERMTTGEYLDIDYYLESKKLDKFVGVMYRPIIKSEGKRYKIKDYEPDEVIDLGEVDHRVLKGSLFFFTNLRESLLNASNTYLQKEMVKMMRKKKSLTKKNNLTKSSVGIQ